MTPVFRDLDTLSVCTFPLPSPSLVIWIKIVPRTRLKKYHKNSAHGWKEDRSGISRVSAQLPYAYAHHTCILWRLCLARRIIWAIGCVSLYQLPFRLPHLYNASFTFFFIPFLLAPLFVSLTRLAKFVSRDHPLSFHLCSSPSRTDIN